MKRPVTPLLWILLALWLLPAAWAQQQDALEAGKQAFREERYADAARLFEQVADAQPENAEAYYLLSRVYFETPLRDTKKAEQALEKALDLQPDNVVFLVGRLQQLRTESWNFFAERVKEIRRLELAKRILKLDPDNAFAHEELGSSYIRDFWRYRNAVMIPTLLYRRGLGNDRFTGDPSTAFENNNEIGVNDGTLLQATGPLSFGTANDPNRVFIADQFDIDLLEKNGVPVQDLSARGQKAYEKAIDHLQKSLNVDPRRRSVYDELMQIYALKGEYGEALTMLQEMYRFFPEDPALWTFLGLAHYEAGNLEAADRSFETAFRYMRPEEQRAYRDLSYLLPREDVHLYEEDPAAYASRFWTSKDPRYLTTYNERLLEHYARLSYADLLYGAPDIDLRGWDTQRGRILVRYGRPIADVVIMPKTSVKAFAAEPILLDALRSPSDVVLDNPDDPTAPGFQAADNVARLPTSSALSRSLFEELNTYNIWEYGAFRFVFEDPFRNGEYRLYSPPASAAAAGADPWINDYEIRARETFRKIPERYEYTPPGRRIDLPYLTTAFRGNDGKTDLFVHYGVPITEYDPSQEMIEVTANLGLFLVGDERDLLVERRRTIYGLPTNQIIPFEETNLWVDTRHVEAPPGTHEVSVEFETASGATVAVQRREVTVPDFSQPALAVSDLMLAYRVEESLDGKPLGPSEVVRNGLSLLPAPWSVYSLEQPIYVYFEVYNLERDASGQTNYEVEILLVPKEQARGLRKFFKGLLGGEKGVAVSYQDSGTTPDEGLYQILDASEQEMGLYTIIVRVRDNHTGRVVENEQDLFLEG